MLLKRLAAAVTCCVLVLATTTARAEDPVPVPADAPAGAEPLLREGVRVRVDEGVRGRPTLRGQVLRLDDQTLLLDIGKDRPVEVRRSDIRRLEFSTGRHRRTKAGAWIGILLFAGPGLWFGYELANFAYCWDRCLVAPFWKLAPSAVIVSAPVVAVGAGLGALVGSAVWTEDWQTAQRSHITVHVGPAPGGVSASVSFRF